MDSELFRRLHLRMDEKKDEGGGGGGGGGDDKDKPKDDDKEDFTKIKKEKDNWREKAKEEEKKRVDAENKLKEIENKKLEEQNDWKKLAENQKKERDELEVKLRDRDAADERRFKESVVKKEFRKHGVAEEEIDTIMPLVKVDQLKYDPDTKAVWGHEEQVKDIKTKLPKLFGTTTGPKPKQDPPKITTTTTRTSVKAGDWRSELAKPLADSWKDQGVDSE